MDISDGTKETGIGYSEKEFNELFEVNIEMILYGTAIIYAEFMDSTHINLDKNLSDIIDSNVENTVFTLAAEDDDLELPYPDLSKFNVYKQ